ncbi:putative phosphodiesterase I [Lupinus albus]|uniref:Putative phosphodiesterase I n=1 Tax=Lupinus albus TaxID=3870 RepID=A0A6A4Q8B3_LUPAL|nr:putative phosphodiesterase I [Lupinus albus]
MQHGSYRNSVFHQFEPSLWCWIEFDGQPLSKIAIHKAVVSLQSSVSITASASVLGTKDTEWVTVDLDYPSPSGDDWVGVFSPAKFNSTTCWPGSDPKEQAPYICSAPIKYKFVNSNTGKASLKFQLINQRADFSFALFSGGLSNPKLVAVSNSVSFANPNAPLYPRLAQGKSWDEVSLYLSS